MGPRSPGIGLQGTTSRLDTGWQNYQLPAGSPAESEPGSATKRLLAPAAHFQGLPTSYGQAGSKEALRYPARQKNLREDALRRGEGGKKQTASISPSPRPGEAWGKSRACLSLGCLFCTITGQVWTSAQPHPTPGN